MDITKRLEIKSNMIFMGERIAFGSECVLMDEAIIEIQTLRAKVALAEALVEALQKLKSEEVYSLDWHCTKGKNASSVPREIKYLVINMNKCIDEALATYDNLVRLNMTQNNEQKAVNSIEFNNIALKQQSEAWQAVCCALDEVKPNWISSNLPAMECAVNAIKKLAQSPISQNKQQEAVAKVLFRQNKDKLEPINFYSNNKYPKRKLKNKFVMMDVYLSPQQPQSVADALEEAANLLDEIGAKLQCNVDSLDYIQGVGAMVGEAEEAIRALIKRNAEEGE